MVLISGMPAVHSLLVTAIVRSSSAAVFFTGSMYFRQWLALRDLHGRSGVWASTMVTRVFHEPICRKVRTRVIAFRQSTCWFILHIAMLIIYNKDS